MGRPKELDEKELKIASMFIVQASGIATADEVKEILNKTGMGAKPDAIRYALEQMRARQILSEAGKMVEGKRHKAYKIRLVIFANVPELPQMKATLPQLLTTPEADKFFALMEGQAETQPEGTDAQVKTRKAQVTDYVMVRLDLETVLPLCGGEIGKEEGKKSFVHNNGHVMVSLPSFMNGIKQIFRSGNVMESRASYLHLHTIFIKPKKALIEVPRSIHDQRTGQGKGVTYYEAVQAGEKFSVWMNYPNTGAMPLDVFIQRCNAGPLRVGAFYAMYGQVRIIGHEVLGDTSEKEIYDKFESQMSKYLGHS